MTNKIKELEATLEIERTEALEADMRWHHTVAHLNDKIHALELELEMLKADMENEINPNDGNKRVYTE